jgi:hypothetical protein
MTITVTIDDFQPSGTRDSIAVSCDCVVEDDEAWIENITDASRALSPEEELEFYAMYSGRVIEKALDAANMDRLYHCYEKEMA